MNSLNSLGSNRNEFAGDGERSAFSDQGGRFRLYLLAAMTVAFMLLCALLAMPFLPAITWGVALAIIAWPMHRWISQRIEKPALASIVSCLIVVIVILVPLMFVSYQLAREATSIANKVEKSPENITLNDKVSATPLGSEIVAWLDRLDIQIETELRRMVGTYTREATGLMQGSLDVALQFLVAVFILYYVLLDRGTFLRAMQDLLPLSRAECDQVFASAADSVHANLYATTITSIINSLGSGLLFWQFGLPAPLLWGVVMFVLSLLPVVGAGMVWVPAMIYLAFIGHWWSALGLLTWGVGTFIFVDNILYVRLAGTRMRMHAVPALIAFLGGIYVFGLSGVILGPAILSVATAFLTLWRRRMSGDTVSQTCSDIGSATPSVT